MATRGIRGATTVPADTPEMILLATRELLQEMMKANAELKVDDIASALFTLTTDLRSAYPAQAARQMGWDSVPMMCAQEIPVPGSPPKVIRALLHWNTDRAQSGIRHVYLGDAIRLRPDLCIPQQASLNALEEERP
ncbi:MAG: chorismate mutase [Bacteroidota bacterium]